MSDGSLSVTSGPEAASARPDPGRAVRFAVYAMLAAAGIWIWHRAYNWAHLWLALTYAPYDDEGYVLVSVRDFLSGRILYDEVFSQYGPAYFAYKALIALVSGLPTHDSARQVTLNTWMASAAATGLGMRWLTRSWWAGLIGFYVMARTLLALGNEPGHPQELLVLLTLVSVAIAASPGSLAVRASLLLSVSTVAILTKVNVGGLLLLAGLLAMAPLGGRSTRLTTALIAALVPVALMWRFLDQWALGYALASSAAILIAVQWRPDPGLTARSFRTAGVAVVAVGTAAILIAIAAVVRHTSYAGLLDGILMRPLRNRDIFVLPLAVPLTTAALSLAAACLASTAVGAVRSTSTWSRTLVAAVQLFVGARVLWLTVTTGRPEIGEAAVVLGTLLLGADRQRDGSDFGRAYLALSAAFATCIAFPVAGSQIVWSTMLLTVAGGVCAWDGLGRLAGLAPEQPVVVRALAAAAGCAVIARSTALVFATAWPQATYDAAVALPFPGAGSIRLEQPRVATYNWLVQNLKAHCSAFVTLPGYSSLYPWSGMPPPTGYNNGAWMLLLTSREQEAVVRRMRSTDAPCAVYHPAGNGWTAEPLAGRPLVDYIEGLTTAAQYEGYELRVPADRRPTWRLDYLQAGSRTYPLDTAGPNSAFPVLPRVVSAKSLRLWFRSAGHGGVLVGAQSAPIGRAPGDGWASMLYIGRDGRLRGGLWHGSAVPVTSARSVEDDAWHHAVLVLTADSQQLYLDGRPIGAMAGATTTEWAAHAQLGNGYTKRWPDANDGWFPFAGTLRDVVTSDTVWTPEAVARDYRESAQSSNGQSSTGAPASARGVNQGEPPQSSTRP